MEILGEILFNILDVVGTFVVVAIFLGWGCYLVYAIVKILIIFIKDIINGEFSWGGGKECQDSWTASSND